MIPNDRSAAVQQLLINEQLTEINLHRPWTTGQMIGRVDALLTVLGWEQMPLGRNDWVTHPDVIEQAEKIAEQFRSSLYEDDALEDWSMEFLVNEGFDPPLGDSVDTGVLNRLLEAQNDLSRILRSLLFPMIARVLQEGDWQEQESA